MVRQTIMAENVVEKIPHRTVEEMESLGGCGREGKREGEQGLG